MAVDTRNDDIVAKYFDVVQEKIKKLISEDKEIKPDQIQDFNDQIFNQEDEIQNQIRYFIDKATMNNLDLDRVAKIIYDKFKVQTKNNFFDTKDSQPVPNPMLGERKHIKTFESFVNEWSSFHSINDIDKILDKISESGIKSLDESDLGILMNYSKDDKYIQGILDKVGDVFKEIDKLKKLMKTNVMTHFEVGTKVMDINNKLAKYQDILLNFFKLKPEDIRQYQKNNNMIPDNNGYGEEDDEENY